MATVDARNALIVLTAPTGLGDLVPLLRLSRVVFFVDVGQTPGAVAVELQHRLLIRVDVVLHAGRHHEETARRQWLALLWSALAPSPKRKVPDKIVTTLA